MTNGYVMVDCGGLDLNDTTEQTITGIYSKSKAALATGKPALATNCVMSGMPCSPVSVVAWDEGTAIVATGHVLRIIIAPDDGVTVIKLVS